MCRNWKQTLSILDGLKASSSAQASSVRYSEAGTHLNIAELYSSTRYHEGALRHSITAANALATLLQIPTGSGRAHFAKNRKSKRSLANLLRRRLHEARHNGKEMESARQLELLGTAFEQVAKSHYDLRQRFEGDEASTCAALVRWALTSTGEGHDAALHDFEGGRPESCDLALPLVNRRCSETVGGQKRGFRSRSVPLIASTTSH